MWLGLIMCQSLCSKNPQARIPQGFGRLGWVDLRIGGVADGDAWRRMATHGDALRKAFPWHWAVILGITRMFPKVGDDFMIFHVTSTIFHPKFRASEYHLGNLVDFLFFFRCPKLRNWPPDATAIEFRTARPPSGLRGVCQCQRCCQKDAWEMTILHL
jgi:hypothetical protein